MQQHGWLWEDWDIRGQRQPRDGGYPARVLWAVAGPRERWIWKGRLVPASTKGGQKHVTLLVSRPFFFSAGFSSSKGGGSRSGQNICNEGFEEGIEGLQLHMNTSIYSSCIWHWDQLRLWLTVSAFTLQLSLVWMSCNQTFDYCPCWHSWQHITQIHYL